MIIPHIATRTRPVARLAPVPGPSQDADDDDLDDLLSETGDVTNRSNGKTGTNTQAEPDRDKPAAPQVPDV